MPELGGASLHIERQSVAGGADKEEVATFMQWMIQRSQRQVAYAACAGSLLRMHTQITVQMLSGLNVAKQI